MSVTLVELGRPSGEQFWFPFTYEEAGRGFTQRWWYNDPVRPREVRFFLRALENNTEVARVELRDHLGVDHYADVPPLGTATLAIQFIEVHDRHRRQGIGRSVINLLGEHFPDVRLIAFSENADGFWDSVGWHRHLYDDPEKASGYAPPNYAPLYVQPQRIAS